MLLESVNSYSLLFFWCVRCCSRVEFYAHNDITLLATKDAWDKTI